MAYSDSDSSLGDGSNYTETNVLLGYASKEATDDVFSQLGGYPTWLDDEAAPPADLAKCKVCNNLMTLLLQIDGRLPSRFPGHERRLYLLSCRRKPCRRKDGSVRGFRGTRVLKSAATEEKATPEPVAREEKKVDLGSALFGGPSSVTVQNANPFSRSSGSSPQANPFAAASSLAASPPQKPASTVDGTNGLVETFAAKARIGAHSEAPQRKPSEPWPPQSSFPTPYTSHHLDAEYETIAAEDKGVPSHARVEAMDVDGAGGSTNDDGGKEDKELFESSMDKTFQRFADRLSHNPEQVLRYEYDGVPLLYSSADAVGKRLDSHGHHTNGGSNAKVTTTGAGLGIPSCQNCGAKRTFEMQLTPHAIEMLEEDEPLSAALDGMDWGTIIMGTCTKDCQARGVDAGEVGYVEEWAGVQWEEVDISALKR